jgi:hypothetical protein
VQIEEVQALLIQFGVTELFGQNFGPLSFDTPPRGIEAKSGYMKTRRFARAAVGALRVVKEVSRPAFTLG